LRVSDQSHKAVQFTVAPPQHRLYFFREPHGARVVSSVHNNVQSSQSKLGGVISNVIITRQQV
jgi:hypothetical protein